MSNVISATTISYLNHDIALFNNHETFFALIFAICLFIGGYLLCDAILHKKAIKCFCSIVIILISMVCGIAGVLDDTEASPSSRTTVDVTIYHNLHLIHKENYDKKHIHSKLVRHHINRLLATQEYYDDTHVHKIKPPMIDHKLP